jgi:3-oxoacyl-[acyl-carrier-protein] synthase-3
VRARIAGTGMYVPPRIVTNHDLAKRMDTSDEWIQQRTGIVQRHHVDPGTGPAALAREASLRALEAAGVEPDQLDAILVASLSPEHDFPGTSAFLQEALGIDTGCAALDVRGQCTGFLYGLQIAQFFVESGRYRRVLLVGSEVHSTGLDLSTRGREVSVIFGDGAGAVVLEPSTDERGILSVHLHAQGRHARKLWVEAPGSALSPRIDAALLEQGRHYPYMDGRFVFKHAVARMPEVLGEALAHNAVELSEVELFLFHQANLRINEAVATRLGIPPEKTASNIERYGNCSAASIPMLLDECVRAGRVEPGDLVAFAGFGSGFTWGSALLRW